MLITKNGIVIRCNVARISVIGRNTQGVRLINLEDGDKVVDIALCDKFDDPLQETDAAATPPDSAAAEGNEGLNTGENAVENPSATEPPEPPTV
jgi:DNA gyrase subunit A